MVVFLRHPPQLVRLGQGRVEGAHRLDLVDLFQQLGVRVLEPDQVLVPGAVEDQVPVEVADFEDRDPQVVGVILEGDVVAERAIGRVLHVLVERQPDEAREHDRQHQTDQGGADDPQGPTLQVLGHRADPRPEHRPGGRPGRPSGCNRGDPDPMRKRAIWSG